MDTFFGVAFFAATFLIAGLFTAAFFGAGTGPRVAGRVFFGTVFLAAIFLAVLVPERVTLPGAIFFAVAFFAGGWALRIETFAAGRFVPVAPARPLLGLAAWAGAAFGRETLTNPRIARPGGRAFTNAFTTNAFTSGRRVGLLRGVDGMRATLVTVVAR